MACTTRQKIAELERIKEAGVLSTTVDGVRVQYRSLEDLDKAIRDLKESDNTIENRRPVVSRIKLSGI